MESKEDVFPTWKSKISLKGHYLYGNPNGIVSWISPDDHKDDTVWIFHRMKDGRFHIINAAGATDGRSYLGTSNGGAQMRLRENGNGHLTRWHIQKVANGLYNIRILSGIYSNTSYLGIEGDKGYARLLFVDDTSSRLSLDVPLMSVTFKLDEGKILSSTPEVLAQQTLPNTTSVDQSMSFSLTTSVTEKSTFEKSAGVSLSVGTEFECGLPFVANGKISVELTASASFTWGQSKTISTEIQATFPAVVPPNKQIVCKAVLTKSTIEVPYVLTFVDGSVETGMWHGVSAWNLREELIESDLNAAETELMLTEVKETEVKENDVKETEVKENEVKETEAKEN